MKKNPNIVLLSVSAILMVVVVAIYGYMQYSIQASISRAILGNQIVLLEKKNINQEQSLMSVYSSTTFDREKLQTLFIPSTEAISFIESIEQLGTYTASKVSLSSVSSENNVDSIASSSFSRINAHVEAVGTWNAVLRTLFLTETLPYQVSLSDVRLSSSGIDDNKSGGGKRSWKLSFNISSDMFITKTVSLPVLK